jgi:Metallo-peptidase family M12
MRTSSFSALLALVLAPLAGAGELAKLDVDERMQARVKLAAGVVETMDIRALRVFAPDAKIWVHGSKGKRELALPNLRFYMALSADKQQRALLIVDGAKATHVSGFAMLNGQQYALSGSADKLDQLSTRELRTPEGIKGGAFTPENSCGVHDQPVSFDTLQPVLLAASAQRAGTRKARLAVDTDNEIMAQKFGDNATTASNWIASLVANMNTQSFEPDLDLTMEIVTINLRPSSVADPYVQNSGGAATQTELEEFGTVWQNNFSGTTRAFAMMISGKSTSPNSASGIAWINSFCRTQSSGGSYSFNKVFKFGNPNDTLPFDALLVGHELGHNLGSNHTHCLDTSATAGLQPVDTCFIGEGGCYSGATSCPAGGRGTLMSYCNIGACSPQQNLPGFGSFVSTLINGRIAANFPSCIQSNGTTNPDTIFRNGFE